MLKNYLKVTLRSLLRYKTQSLINIGGLTLGLTSCILILLWVREEISFDRFHKNHERIYRVVTELQQGEKSSKLATTPGPLAPALQEKFPEIVTFARFYNFGDLLIQYGEKKTVESNLSFADPALLDMFSFPLVEGNLEEFRAEKYSIILTRTLAKKYFENRTAIGEIIQIDGLGDLRVCGISGDVPANSQLQFDGLLPFSLLEKLGEPVDQWGRFRFFSYLLLENDVDQNIFAEKLSSYFLDSDVKIPAVLHLQPLSTIYFDREFAYDMVLHGDHQYVYIFTVVAFFVLIIACINFMNLSTARSRFRGKEVGIRKVAGASRRHLIVQFLGESIILSFLSLLFSLLLVELLLPAYNSLTQKQLSIHYLSDLPFLAFLVMLTLVTGVLAGSYPALVLSSFKPVKIFTGTAVSGIGHSLFRKILVVIQFAISVVLLTGTIVVYRQISFIRQSTLAADPEQIVYLMLKGDAQQKVENLRDDLLKTAGVKQVSASMSLPFRIGAATSGIDWPGKDPEERFFIAFTSVDYDYLDLFGMEVIQGRKFDRQYSTDRQSAFIINETAAQKLQLKETVGTEINFMQNKGKIIGVVKDFHFRSLHHPIEPLILGILPDQYPYYFLFVKFETSQTAKVLAECRNFWQAHSFKYPLDYRFLDDSFENMYRSENRVGQIFIIFAAFAILISCLGLFGLASFVSEQRTKEIGVRKVMGASTSSIVLMLSGDFIKWVLVANLIAWPLAYITMRAWLQNFAYRIEVGWSVLAIATILSLVIALLTISLKSIRTAIANPVEALRYE